MNDNSPTLNQSIALFVGIDWADQKHDCHIIDSQGRESAMELPHTPEAINQWIAKMTEKAKGGKIAIMLEQSKGPLIHALMFRQNIVLYPINPKQLSRYRESYPGGDGKSDPTDAMYLARLLRERIETLKAWLPDDEQTRLLNRLCEQRRFIVGSQTKLRQQLISVLKQYFPVVLELFGKSHQLDLLLAVLKRWPDPRQLRRADRRLIVRVLREHGVRNEERQEEALDAIRSSPLLCDDSALITPMSMTVKHLAQQIEGSIKTIEQFDQQISESFKAHGDAHLFSSLRGAGPALAPRLLCAFGSQRDRWSDADELASFSGIAPITRQSGKQRHVQRRYACPKYLRQTFHEFAAAARTWCPWTKARYQMLRAQGMKHHAVLRKLARSWIRILYRVWQTRIPFDCGRYIETLKRRLPGIVPYLENS
ncbi:IS110 family transposase [Planctomycetes bacterium TBK1r]|uniref:Transposase n=1 Tax=Stieleria magnilauensis TaxID=2527963 RepID=A0ABX5XRI8_9BACT|nr:Transposase [Planctomycetes bacterium TBK1r]QDV88878.1 Transposase [Planctomycetes bacterium TBK1r]